MDAGQYASVSYSFVNGNQEGKFRIDSLTGKIYSSRTLVGKAGVRFEISASAADNSGVPPFNVAANLTSARVT